MFAVIRTSLTATLAGVLLAATPLWVHAGGPRGWDSAESAFVAAFITSGIGQRGYDENREYAAALYQMPDGRWYATPVVAGNERSCNIPYELVPAQAVRIAGAHTHGQPHIAGDSLHEYGTDFSQADRRIAVDAYRITRGRVDSQWLLTSRLQVLQMSVEMHYNAASARIDIAAQVRLIGRWDRVLMGEAAAERLGR